MKRSLACALATTALLAPLAASADDNQTFLWVLRGDDATSTETLEQIFSEVLSGELDSDHIVGRRGLEDYLRSTPIDVPACLAGTGTCSSTAEAVATMLEADRIAYVEAEAGGTLLRARIVDVGSAHEELLQAHDEDLRSAVYQMVVGLTDSTGMLDIRTNPSGAEVFIDGTLVGTTPLRTRQPIGPMSLEIRSERYFDVQQNIELRANDSRAIDLDLERRYAQLRVRSGTPGAEVFINDEGEAREVNELLDLPPGTHFVTVRAEGYSPQSSTFSLIAGDQRDHRVILQHSPQWYADRQRNQIDAWPVRAQLRWGFGAQRTELQGLRFDQGRGVCPLDDQGACVDSDRAGHTGLIGDTYYGWEWLELGALGLGYQFINVPDAGYGSTEGEVTSLARGREWNLRFLQPGARHMFDHRWEVFGHTGPAVTFERFGAPDLDEQRRRNSFWWEMDAGARFHTNALVYAFVDTRLGFNLSHSDSARFSIGAGLGLNLPDPTPVDERLQDVAPPRLRNSNIPTEL